MKQAENIPKYGTDEGRARKDGNCDASVHGIPEIGQSTSDYSEWSAAEYTTEEPAYHDCLYVLCDGDGYLEDDEDGVANEQRESAAVELRERAPLRILASV